MAEIFRTKIKWLGFSGAPGYTVLYWSPPDGQPVDSGDCERATDHCEGLIGAFKPYVPSGANMAVESDCEVIEDTTGELKRVYSGLPAAPQAGTGGSGAYSASSGAVITWRTDGVRNGRRVRGRSFIVPLSSSAAYSSDGSLASAAQSAILAGAALMHQDWAAGERLVVWGRPSGPGQSDGVSHRVTNASVPDILAVLRSRRD
jgi:hypothetical protein